MPSQALQHILDCGEDSQHQFKREITRLHRNYFDNASIRSLVFRNRIEIISPCHLPGNLSTADIQHGKTKRHNPVLSEHAAHLLPYRGLGSGIHRALQAWPQIELQDHHSGNEFWTAVARPKPPRK